MSATLDAFACDGLSLTATQGKLGLQEQHPAHGLQTASSCASSASSSASGAALQTSLHASDFSDTCEAASEPRAEIFGSRKPQSPNLHIMGFQVPFDLSKQAQGHEYRSTARSVEMPSNIHIASTPWQRPAAPVRSLKVSSTNSGRASRRDCHELAFDEGRVSQGTQTAVALPCSPALASRVQTTWNNYAASSRRRQQLTTADTGSGTSIEHLFPTAGTGVGGAGAVPASLGHRFTQPPSAACYSPAVIGIRSSLSALRQDTQLLLADVQGRRRRMRQQQDV